MISHTRRPRYHPSLRKLQSRLRSYLVEMQSGTRRGNRNAVAYHSPGLADHREAYPGNRTTHLRRSSPVAFPYLVEMQSGTRRGNRNAVVYHSPGLADRREAYPGNRTTHLRRSSPVASINRHSAETATNPRSTFALRTSMSPDPFLTLMLLMAQNHEELRRQFPRVQSIVEEGTPMADVNVKNAVTELINTLPDSVSWDEVQYHLYVRQQIEAGLADSAAGRVIDTSEMRRRLADRKDRKRGQ
jgi:predicted transcriptional regulator